jgi:hypothetical protein
MGPYDFIRVLMAMTGAFTALAFIAFAKGSPDAGALLLGAIVSCVGMLLAAFIQSTREHPDA